MPSGQDAMSLSYANLNFRFQVSGDRVQQRGRADPLLQGDRWRDGEPRARDGGLCSAQRSYSGQHSIGFFSG